MKHEVIRRGRGVGVSVYLCLTGLLAGFVNGLLGAGGGIPVVFALSGLLREELRDRRELYANALCVMLPISAVSCVRYALAGNLRTEGFGVYALPALLGGVVGGILLGRVKGAWLSRLFGLLVVVSGILLIVR